MHKDCSTSTGVCGMSCVSIACRVAQSTVFASIMIGIVWCHRQKARGQEKVRLYQDRCGRHSEEQAYNRHMVAHGQPARRNPIEARVDATAVG